MHLRHKWIVVSMEERPSDYELALKAPRGLSFNHLDNRTFYRRPTIVKSRCDTCGTEKVEVH